MKAKFAICLLFACAAIPSFSQKFRSIESIGAEAVSVIEIAGNGDVWVGTIGAGARFYPVGGGVVYYDSTNTSMKSNSVRSLLILAFGAIPHAYIGTAKGLADIANGTLGLIGPLIDSNVVGTIYRHDSLWALSTTALTRFDSTDTQKQSLAFASGPITSAPKTSSQCSVFCIGTANNGCYNTSDGVTFDIINTGAPYHLLNNHVNAAVIENNCGRKFIGTPGGLSICPPPGGPPCRNYTTANGLPENDITAIIQGCNGNLWLGTRSSGVVIYKFADSSFTRITTANGLSSDSITAIALDSNCTTKYIGLANGDVAVLNASNTVVRLLSDVKNILNTEYVVYVFPQPAKGQLNFVFESELVNAELYLTDLSGRQIRHLNIKGSSTTAIDVSGMAAGIYFYQLLSAGQQLKAGKVLIVN